MKSEATNINDYITSLPDERQTVVIKLVDVIRKNIPGGFSEAMGYGMPGWVVPHSIYPKGYHCDTKLPLPFLSIASQKNHISLYHMGLYAGELLDWFLEEWPKNTSTKLDMGKSCIRFKKNDDIPYDLIGNLVSKISPAEWITIYESNFVR